MKLNIVKSLKIPETSRTEGAITSKKTGLIESGRNVATQLVAIKRTLNSIPLVIFHKNDIFMERDWRNYLENKFRICKV